MFVFLYNGEPIICMFLIKMLILQLRTHNNVQLFLNNRLFCQELSFKWAISMGDNVN
jgi:hypothetical protein